MRTILAVTLTALVAASGPACGGGDPATTVHFTLPGTAGADYFDLPFPNELHRTADGKVDLAGVPRPSALVGEYLDEFTRSGYGFGTQSAIYFRLSAALDPASLPDSTGSTQAGAPLFLVDVDPASPDHGVRTPVRCAFRATAGQFIGPNWLAVTPYPGFVLRGDTRYAAVVTTAVRDARGRAVAPAPALAAILDGGGDATARAAMQPLLDWLDGDASAPPRAAVAGATVFRTQDATATMFRLRAIVETAVAAPTAADLVHTGTQANVEVFEGTYQGPNFQQGTPPYMVPSQGGAFALDESGDPTVARTETLRFAVTVPKGTMPAAGWPIVLHAHGTGGDYLTFVDRGQGDNLGLVTDATGAELGAMASFGIDQVLHGPRDPSGRSPDITFFNFQNIAAARDNVRQGAADNFQLLRLARTLTVTMPDGSTARFDASRVAFMGHSQGGLTGPGFVAAAPDVRAAVLSGAGANLIQSLLGKTEPVDIPALVAGLLGEDVDEFHPFLNLVQMYFEPGDPGNYARGFFREPALGQPAKDVFHSLGIVDHYTPLTTIMALAVAMGVQPVTPVLEPVLGMDLAGVAAVAAPVTGNVAGGAATGVLCQYEAPAGDDGHFVLFHVPAAKAAYARFLASAMRDEVATLSP